MKRIRTIDFETAHQININYAAKLKRKDRQYVIGNRVNFTFF